MDRIVGLITGFVLVLVLVAFSTGASAAISVSRTMGDAMGLCYSNIASYQSTHPNDHQTFSCPIGGSANGAVVGSDSACDFQGGKYTGYLYPHGSASDLGGMYWWCVPATCDAGQTSGYPGQQYNSSLMDGDVRCNDSCLSRWHADRPLSICTVDGSQCSSFGHFETNGGWRCATLLDSGLLKKKFDDLTCDKGNATGSCYDGRNDRFCGVTEYGEKICAPRDPLNNDKPCVAGATGAFCVTKDGNPPPKPPDPPVPPNKPPDQTDNFTSKDANTGTTNNYTTNNYSGTSDGGGSGGSSGSSGGSQGGTGSQTNTNGSGNSPGPQGGKGTDSSGKCSDGSVPTASGCSGTATDTGCDTPPTCYGDAVMCGNFRELQAIRCNTRPGSSSSSGSYGNVGDALAGAGVPSDGGASGDPDASGMVTDQEIGKDGFDGGGLGFTRSCPAPPTFQFQGRTYTIDTGPVCNWASIFGWLVVLIASLAGVRIVAGGRS